MILSIFTSIIIREVKGKFMKARQVLIGKVISMTTHVKAITSYYFLYIR